MRHSAQTIMSDNGVSDSFIDAEGHYERKKGHPRLPPASLGGSPQGDGLSPQSRTAENCRLVTLRPVMGILGR